MIHRPADLRFTVSGVIIRGELAGQGGIDRGSKDVFGVIQRCQRVGEGAGGSQPRRTGGGGVAAGSSTSRAAARADKARERSFAVRFPPRANSRMPSIASRGRVSAGALASKSGSARSAQPAAQSPITRSSSRLSGIFTDV